MKTFLFEFITPRKIREKMFQDLDFFKQLLKVPYYRTWFKHFSIYGRLPDEGATCEECLIFLSSDCKSDNRPEDCMFLYSLIFEEFSDIEH